MSGQQQQQQGNKGRDKGGKRSHCFVMHRVAVNINNDKERCCCNKVIPLGCHLESARFRKIHLVDSELIPLYIFYM